jgi:hypothetical protein
MRMGVNSSHIRMEQQAGDGDEADRFSGEQTDLAAALLKM